ncbi:ADP-ribosylglycohydrolase family protein [Arthrobacter gandavensis]|uniref:ADP-ribosylglycohydrolase family protein n=1 Tax=Arthrobacter gandavensis TaxID=169960 RepID=UPI002B267B1D|nr:ADP-ribosylglycohydrolase family protein [Arthrobacter gandavensis]
MNNSVPLPQADPELFRSKVRACLLGGALGDALGYAVEFDSLDGIRARFGTAGLTDFSQLDKPAPVSDDTQMTLYTVDGLVEVLQWANDGVGADETACLWLSYLRWLKTQGESLPANAPYQPDRWIDAQDVLHHRRAPGNACLSGLLTGEMGTKQRPVNAGSKGCGTVMRSAPFGLLPYVSDETVYKFSADGAALTHGHPSALHSAAVFSALIHDLLPSGAALEDAAAAAVERALASGVPELAERLAAAVRLAAEERAGRAASAPDRMKDALGEGWVAEEALAIGLYAALAASDAGTPQEHFRRAVAVAVNHDGASDSAASMAGNILGVLYGTAALPADWLQAIDARETVEAMADAFIGVTAG